MIMNAVKMFVDYISAWEVKMTILVLEKAIVWVFIHLVIQQIFIYSNK